MRKRQKSSYEDLQGHIRNLKTPKIEVWENKYSDREYTIHLETAECTCICPKTGLPDFVTLKITYAPAKVCLELKSLKLYLVFFRTVGIFHEHLANKILDDIVKACRPRWAKVEGAVAPRGGITATVLAQSGNKMS
jgi:7-cyano-7-deazaguanine reductase